MIETTKSPKQIAAIALDRRKLQIAAPQCPRNDITSREPNIGPSHDGINYPVGDHRSLQTLFVAVLLA
jgi:hypothetical protein